jgi:hypothetical protein
LTAGIAFAVVGAAPAVGASDSDAELVALADRLKHLHPKIVGAAGRLEEAGDRYEAIKPERSEALNWRPCDADFVGRYSNTASCTDESVDALRGRKFVVWEFTGTDKELDQLNPNWLGRSVIPVPGHEHLFVSQVDERRQARAAELIAALDEYRAQNEAAIRQSGSRSLEDALEVLHAERDEITDRMIELKPKTLGGVQALATAIVYAEWAGDIRNRPNQSLEDEMMNAILRALTEQSLAT